MPRPIIEIGSRASSPAALNGTAPGSVEHAAVGRGRHPAVTVGHAAMLGAPRSLGLAPCDPSPAPYDALLRGLVRRAREARGRGAVPGERHPGPRHPAGAAGGGRRALLPVRRPQPDQRPQPRVHRRGRGGPPRAPGSTCPSTGATATGTPTSPTPSGRCATTAYGGRCACSPAPTRATPAAGSTARTSPTRSPRSGRAPRGWTGCGTTSTTPASWSRWSTPPSPRWPSCRPQTRNDAQILFVTHSIPTAMNDASGCAGRPQTGSDGRRRLRRAAPERRRPRSATGCGSRPGTGSPAELVFCSRSGPPQRAVARARRGRPDPASWPSEGVPAVVVVPIGFVSDHMEVVYDLDTEAQAVAEEAGIAFARAATAGVDPRFVAMVRELVLERGRRRAAGEETRSAPRSARLGAVLGRVPAGLLRQRRAARGPPCAARTEAVTGERCATGPARRAARGREDVAVEAADLVRERRRAGVEVADSKSSARRRRDRGRPRGRDVPARPAGRAAPRRRLPGRGGRRGASRPPASPGSSTRSTAPSTSSTASRTTP